MIRRPPRSTLSSSSAASDVYKRQLPQGELADVLVEVFVCRRLDALDRAGEADGVQVGFQNGLLGVGAAQAEGAVDLAHLAQGTPDAAGALVRGQVLDELLFQRRRALLGAVDRQHILVDHGADGALEVDARLIVEIFVLGACLLYTSPSPRDGLLSRMPSSA